MKDIESIIKNILTNKVTEGEIPLNVLKQSNFTYVYFTNFTYVKRLFNDSLLKYTFPDSLKFENITPVQKKDEQTDKENYRPVSILPKNFEILIYDQLKEYLEQYLDSLQCGFKKAYSTQNTLVRLLQKWQNELDNSAFAGIILMDLS